MSIRVIELMDHVLSMYDRAIGEYTAGEQPALQSLKCPSVHTPRAHTKQKSRVQSTHTGTCVSAGRQRPAIYGSCCL